MDYAVNIARTMGSTMHLLHVVDTPRFPKTLWNYKELEEALYTKSQIEMESIAAPLRESGIQVITEIHQGKPWDEIIDYVHGQSINVICMGTHGHNSLDDSIFGSVTERVLRKARIPVIVMRSSGGGR